MNTHTARFAAVSQPSALVVVLALVLGASLAVATAGGVFNDRPVVMPPVATPSASPGPSDAPSAPASPAVISVDLIEKVGTDATIDITDRSGSLVTAASGVPGDGASVPDGTVAVTGLAADPATIVLTWSGLPCDTTHALTIDSDGLTMTLETPVCEGDALGIDHVLQLTFDHPVDPDAVVVTIRTNGG